MGELLSRIDMTGLLGLKYVNTVHVRINVENYTTTFHATGRERNSIPRLRLVVLKAMNP